MLEGMLPVRRLLNMDNSSKLDICPRADGMLPEILLEFTSQYSRFVRLPTTEGTLFDSLL